MSFLLLFGCIASAGVALMATGPVDRTITVPFAHVLAVICAAMIHLFGGSVTADAGQLTLVGNCGSVAVAGECSALQVSLLYAAAVLAFPAPLRLRLIGALGGAGLIQTLNLVRIISLLYLSCWSAQWFEFFHLYLWSNLIVFDALVSFLGWHWWQASQPRVAG